VVVVVFGDGDERVSMYGAVIRMSLRRVCETWIES
jgi:hypothetical protein